jgi:hypothetical protein
MYGALKSMHHRVHTEWQRPLSGAHSIVMEILAQPGEGGGLTPTPFHFIYHHAPAERAYTVIHSPYFISTSIMYTVIRPKRKKPLGNFFPLCGIHRPPKRLAKVYLSVNPIPGG